MEKQLANQKNIDKLIEYINGNYNIETWKALFFPYIINLKLKDKILTIDTSRSYKFELVNSKLIFTNYFESCESVNLEEYRKELINE